MARYVMTPARKRALRKAQLASARKRVRNGARKVGKVLDTHKYAIGMAVAGVAVGSGVYGAMYVSNKRAMQRKRVEVTQKMKARRKAKAPGGGRAPFNDRLEWRTVGGPVSGSSVSRVVDPTKTRGKIKVFTSSKNPTVIAIMNELSGQPSGRNSKRKYVVVSPGLEPRN